MALNVLFICVENSCRSQIAEAFARGLGAGAVEAWSAGSRPSGRVHPTAVAVMRGRGFDLSAHRSKGIDELPAKRWDYVVTMGCGDACPAVAAEARLEWDIPDPKALPEDGFQDVCDLIEAKVRALILGAKPG